MKLTFIRNSTTKPMPQVPIPLWGLTEEGIERAQRLAQTDLVKSIKVLYSSLQTKALETAVLLGKLNAIPIKAHPGLTEITSFTRKFLHTGVYEKSFRSFYDGIVERISEGENCAEGLARFEKALDEIVAAEGREEAEDVNVGIVSHGNILSFYSSKFVGKTPLEIHGSMRMPDIAVFNWDSKKFELLFGEVEV